MANTICDGRTSSNRRLVDDRRCCSNNGKEIVKKGLVEGIYVLDLCFIYKRVNCVPDRRDAVVFCFDHSTSAPAAAPASRTIVDRIT